MSHTGSGVVGRHTQGRVVRRGWGVVRCTWGVTSPGRHWAEEEDGAGVRPECPTSDLRERVGTLNDRHGGLRGGDLMTPRTSHPVPGVMSTRDTSAARTEKGSWIVSGLMSPVSLLRDPPTYLFPVPMEECGGMEGGVGRTRHRWVDRQGSGIRGSTLLVRPLSNQGGPIGTDGRCDSSSDGSRPGPGVRKVFGRVGHVRGNTEPGRPHLGEGVPRILWSTGGGWVRAVRAGRDRCLHLSRTRG